LVNRKNYRNGIQHLCANSDPMDTIVVPEYGMMPTRSRTVLKTSIQYCSLPPDYPTSTPALFCPPHKSRAHGSDVQYASRIKILTPNLTFFHRGVKIDNRALPHTTLQYWQANPSRAESSRPNWSRTKPSTAASSTPEPGFRTPTRARDDTLQDGARTTVHALPAFHIASHSATLSAVVHLCVGAGAGAHPMPLSPRFASRCANSSSTSTHIHLCKQGCCRFCPLLLRRRIMVGSAPSCAMGIQKFRTLSYRRMGLRRGRSAAKFL